MNSWFDILSLEGGLKNINGQDVINNSKIIEKNIHDEAKLLKGDYTKVFLGGFSQGCSMSLFTGLSLKENVGGIVGCSGTFFKHLIKVNETKRTIPMFYYIGEDDQVVDCWHAKKSLQPLIDLTFNIEIHSEKYLQHSLSDTELVKLRAFFKKNMI